MGIERYRAIVRLEEIRSLMELEDYDAAKETADSIRKERLKDSSDLFLLASVYRKCGEYDVAKEYLLRIYEKKVTWRVLEELMEVCLAEKKPEEAESYLKEYAKISGGDPRNYIYEYRIGRQKHRPDEELLPILQTLKAEEYSEKYAYELAKLYHKLGRGQECMAECADLILWFGEGTYVERAKALQAYYRGELSAEDIQEEAKRRIKEAEERKERAEAEQRAYEAEKRRREEEERLAEEARQVEAERLAEEARQQEAFLAEETQKQNVVADTDAYPEEMPVPEEAYEPVEDAVAKEDVSFDEETFASELEDIYAEVAATEIEEPMWEEDATAVASVVASDEEAAEPDAYEQMSLFGATNKTEPSEEEESEMAYVAEEETGESEEQEASPLGKELSARLAEKGIVFEDVLHQFARIEKVRKQLVRMLEVVVTVRKKCHCLIITGERKSGKTTLGTYLAKLLYELSYVKTPRVAKINGDRLNQINLYEKKMQLQDVCLIVEHAGNMTEETVEALLGFIRSTHVLGTVILEDNPTAMNRLLRNNAECNQVFNNRVHLAKYDGNELMGFALEYMQEQDYSITPEAKKVLRQEVENLTRTEHKEGRLVATRELICAALERADYRNKDAILTMASAGNFLGAKALELIPEDFGTGK